MTAFTKLKILLPLLTVLFSGLVAEKPARAAALTFFGEDLPTVKDQPLDLTPNADQARDNFLSSLTDVQIEDFEGLAIGSAAPLTLDFGETAATLTGDGDVKSEASAGTYAISGQQYWSWTSSNTSPDEQFSIQFEEAQAAFGFSATDVGDTFGGSGLIVSFGLANGETLDVPLNNSRAGDGNVGGSALFFGYIDPENLFTSVTFKSDRLIAWDGFGFDDLIIGTSELDEPEPTEVPEPSSLLGLLSLGLFYFSTTRRKK